MPTSKIFHDCFDSKLVRLKEQMKEGIANTKPFRFQTGSIKRRGFAICQRQHDYGFDSKLVRLKDNSERASIDSIIGFDSKLVRLKGFVTAMYILYAILMGRVKSIFRFVVFKVALLSTSGSAKLLGG